MAKSLSVPKDRSTKEEVFRGLKFQRSLWWPVLCTEHNECLFVNLWTLKAGNAVIQLTPYCFPPQEQTFYKHHELMNPCFYCHYRGYSWGHLHWDHYFGISKLGPGKGYVGYLAIVFSRFTEVTTDYIHLHMRRLWRQWMPALHRQNMLRD